METSEGRFCPVCKFKNDAEAEICQYCGASMASAPTGSPPTTEMVGLETVQLSKPPAFKTDALIPKGGIAFFMLDSIKPFVVLTLDEIILGRLTEDSLEGCVDLTPHGAFSAGVSRRHAMIRRKKDGFEITDLDSTNGTSVDDFRLIPSRTYDLPNGATLRLARMTIKVAFNPVNK